MEDDENRFDKQQEEIAPEQKHEQQQQVKSK
jgi:hypothetical protein